MSEKLGKEELLDTTGEAISLAIEYWEETESLGREDDERLASNIARLKQADAQLKEIVEEHFKPFTCPSCRRSYDLSVKDRVYHHIEQQRPKVSRGWVEKVACVVGNDRLSTTREYRMEMLLKEIGLEVEE